MKNNNWFELFLSAGLVVLGVLLLNPFEIWMPDLAMFCMTAVGLAAFGFLGTFVLRESAHDERERHERSLAGRVAFLAGSGTLLIAVLIEGYNHEVDPWLVVALSIMLLSKIGTRLYSDWTL